MDADDLAATRLDRAAELAGIAVVLVVVALVVAAVLVAALVTAAWYVLSRAGAPV